MCNITTFVITGNTAQFFIKITLATTNTAVLLSDAEYNNDNDILYLPFRWRFSGTGQSQRFSDSCIKVRWRGSIVAEI